MLRRIFLLNSVFASPVFASYPATRTPPTVYDQSYWKPELLERAKLAMADENVIKFLDDTCLQGPPPAFETELEISFLLKLQQERKGNGALSTLLDLQNGQPIEAMLRMSLAPGSHDAERRILKKACDAIEPFLLAAKYRFMRPRPSHIDSRLHPHFDVPGHPSYPSGHAAQGCLCGEILAQLHPDRAEYCFEAGASMGLGREVAGVHFPSDTAAGHCLAIKFWELNKTSFSNSL